MEWATRDGGPRTQGQEVEEGRQSSIRLDTTALSREVAGGAPGDHLRDRNAGALRAGHQRPQGDARSAGTAGEDVLGAGAAVHHVRQACRGSSRGWI